MIRPRLALLLMGLLWPSAKALASEEAVRREEVDAGVHLPVMTKAPELLLFVPAPYPPEAQAQGLTADVSVLITLAADGSVSDAVVPNPVGNGFDEAAISAARQLKFSPAEVDGVPAPVQMEYVYRFVLQEAAPDAGPAATPMSTLKGELVARGSRTRISAGTVRCGDDPEAPEAVSDEQGRFELKVPSGPCDVRVMASGFHLFETKESLAPNEVTEVIYHVIPKAVGFETVVRGVREKKEVVRRTLERQELQKIPGSMGDPVRVLQNFPGVARAPFLFGALIVRGASPAQTLTFLDGVEIPILYHLGGGPSVVNGEFLDRIDFFPGGFGSRYGRAVGGVVDVATRKGASDAFHGVAKADLQDASFFVEAPVTDGVSVAAAARRSYIDALIPLVLPKDPEGGSLLILPAYWDYQARVDIGTKRGEAKKDGSSTYSVMAFGSDDVLKIVATGGGRNVDLSLDIHTVFHRVVGNWTHRKGNLSWVMTPYAGYDLANLNFGTTAVRADQFEVGLRQDLGLELTKWLTMRTGTDLLFDHLIGVAEIPVFSGVQYVGFPGAEPKTEVQRLERVIQAWDGAAFLEADVKVGPVTVTPGLRASHAYLNKQTRFALDPRLWARYQVTETTQIKGSVGLYTQPPEASDLEEPPFGNPALVHEKAFQSSLGVEQKITDAINIDLTGFYNRRFDNVVSPGDTVVHEDGSVTRTFSSNAGLGQAYGLEVLLRHDVTKNFFGWVAYTLNRSEQRRAGEWPYVLTADDQTHILTAVGSYRLPYGFEVGARFRYVTGRPSTPLLHPFDLYNSDNNRFNPTRGEARSARLVPFNQLDIRIDKSWLFTHWTLTAYVDVQNVYNAQNVEATFFDYRFREEVAVPGIPILPIVGVKGSF